MNLAWDNFQGTVHSYVTVAMVDNFAGTSLEWVREDPFAIKANNGAFPSAAGIYYIELTEQNEFYVDPLLEIRNERVSKISDTEYRVQHSYLDGSLRLYLLPSNRLLYKDVNYTEDPTTGTITLTRPISEGMSLSADYRYAQPSRGPFTIKPKMLGLNQLLLLEVLV